MNKAVLRKRLTSAQILLLGFASVILVGALLLMLPFATTNGKGATFLEALFTTTSATCVTGQIVQDTGTYWTLFGHIIILILIQIGGLGFMTMAIVVVRVSGRKISLMQRSTLEDSISADGLGGLVRLATFIFKTTFIIEGIGALILSTRFIPQYGFIKGLWYGVFHSISGFCNAGFDILGTESSKFNSLVDYAGDPVVSITIPLLIIIGGIGFLTWEDVRKNKLNYKKYRLQTKVILSFTAGLIIIPAIYFYFFEFTNYSGFERVLVSFFQSVTTRTAGFNTADLTQLSHTGIMVMVSLMLIGAAPGSTGGGMKVTTFATVLSTMSAVFKKRKEPRLFHRRLEQDTINTAITVFLMYITMFLLSALIISKVENLPILTCFMETASCSGTVGLTLGITKDLSNISRVILIILMYLGRVGGLTLIYGTVAPDKNKNSRYPVGSLNIG